MDVKKLLLDTLDEFSYHIYLQGSMSDEDEYPDNFFTFFNTDTVDSDFYDNENNEVIWDFDLNFYSNDPVKVNSVLLDAKKKLKAVGFIPDGSGHDILSDEASHTGRGLNLIFIERKKVR